MYEVIISILLFEQKKLVNLFIDLLVHLHN
jgi:hypothetical protein